MIATDIPAEEQGTGMLFNMDGEVVGMISSSVWNDTGKNVVNAYGISDLKPIIRIAHQWEKAFHISEFTEQR